MRQRQALKGKRSSDLTRRQGALDNWPESSELLTDRSRALVVKFLELNLGAVPEANAAPEVLVMNLAAIPSGFQPRDWPDSISSPLRHVARQ
jgi:hypothetical protein